jgi:acyl carrier protein
MTEESFTRHFTEALEEVIGEVPSGVSLETALADLDIDSLARIEIMICLENSIQTRVDDERIRQVQTGRDLYEAFAGAVASGRE